MPYTEKSKEYTLKYKKEKLKRVPLDLQMTGDGLTYELLQSAASSQGEGINTFIKQACIERIERIMRHE